MAHFTSKVMTLSFSMALIANPAVAEPVIKYADTKPLQAKAKVVKVVAIGQNAKVEARTIAQVQTQVRSRAGNKTAQSSIAALPQLAPIRQPVSQKPKIAALPGLKPITAKASEPAPIATKGEIKTLSTSKVVVQPLSPLAPIQAKPAVKKQSVSPFGQWLAGAFGWIDDVVDITPVKPWQKSILAEPVMSAAGVNAEQTKFAKKVFISKEASSGGDGVAGGGCGCK